MKEMEKVVQNILAEIAKDPECVAQIVDSTIRPKDETAIIAVLKYRSCQLKISPWLLESMLTDHFGVEEISKLRISQYHDVIGFLIEYKGENVH